MEGGSTKQGVSSLPTKAVPRDLTVVLVQVGESFSYDVNKLALLLNRNSSPWMRFKGRLYQDRDFSDYALVDELQISSDSPFWSAAKAMALLQRVVKAEDDEFVIGITPAWLADPPDDDDDLGSTDTYLGVWHNRFVPPYGAANYAIISTSAWQSRYERSSYRSVEQYIAHMVVAAIGDYLVEKVQEKNQDWPGLTHSIYQNCVFDFTPDQASIVPAVQRSRICGRCQKRISVGQLRLNRTGDEVSKALDKILHLARVPPSEEVFRALHEDPRFSVLVISGLLSLFVGIVGQFISASITVGLLVALACGATIVGIWYKKRVQLTGKPLY